MASRGQVIELTDFTGGLNTFDPEYSQELNSSPDLDNVIVLDKGFKKRQGDTAFNSSAMVGATTPITGLGYIKLNSGTEYLNAIAGTKFFTSSSLSGTMADTTGAVTITSAATNLWTPVNYNNLQIWFGGAPNPPFKYSGSGNAAALGGTPPSAYTGFVANNRIFAISTTANPSNVYWPVLSDPEDWTGSGSGNSAVSKSDGEALQFGVVVGADAAILFKNSSSHMMVLTRQPFPIYQLQKGYGVAGRNAWAFANGVIYLVTPSRRMVSTTDGVNFTSYPSSINDIWDSINSTRIPYIVGAYYPKLEWIVWSVSTGSSTSNNYAIIWDLRHKCWLRCTTGFKCNVMALVQNRRLFGGHYDGKVYEKDVTETYTDASVASPFIINGYWRTPFKNLGGLDTTVHPIYADIAALSETSTNLSVSYGFDFTADQTTETISLTAGGAQWDVAQWDVDVFGGQEAVAQRVFITGRGNLFSLKLKNATASQAFTIQGISIRLRTDKARKLLAVT